MQVGLTAEEKQQLQGISLEQLLSAFRAESSKFSKGSSAYRGVSYNKSQRKYRAFVRDQGKLVALGCFDIEEDAAHAYDEAARRCYGRYTFAAAVALVTPLSKFAAALALVQHSAQTCSAVCRQAKM